MKPTGTQEPPRQEGDLSEWLADSLVYIQNATTTLVRDSYNFQGRTEQALAEIKSQAGAEQFDKALDLLAEATRDFHKAGWEADKKRRSFGMWPTVILGGLLLCGIAAQTVYLSGVVPGVFGSGIDAITERNKETLESCIKAVRESNSAFRCTLVVRPEDL